MSDFCIDKYPERAKALMDSAVMCLGEICIHSFEKSDVFYIKVTNLNGYRELVCKVTTFDESDDIEPDMRIDFVSTNMSDAKKYYVLWLLERNRDFLFDVYKGKFAADSTDEKDTYLRYVKILGNDEEL